MKTHNYKGKEIPKEDWGIWDEENNLYKYPLDTKEHTESAIKLYGHYADTKYAEELAHNIIRHIKKYNIPDEFVGENNKLRNHMKISANEANIGSKKAYPVFIITSFTSTPFGKIYKMIDRDIDVSHACISFDSSLENMYTFNMAAEYGLTTESIKTYAEYNEDSYIRVYTIFLKEKDFDKMKQTIKDIKFNISKYSYNVKGLFDILLNRIDYDNYKMVCSEFVSRMLSLTGIESGIDKSDNLISPQDLHEVNKYNNKAYITYDGLCKNYSSKEMDKILKKIKSKSEYIKEGKINSLQYMMFHEEIMHSIIEESYIMEAKEFPVDFEADGSIIIKNYKKLDFEAEYAKSHKLLKLYAEHENLEGIKYELSKLWFMNNVLEKRIYSDPPEDKLTAYTKVRARILNDFNKYLKFVLEREKDFNFTEYYNNSPFSDVSIRIPGSLISNLSKLIKQIL